MNSSGSSVAVLLEIEIRPGKKQELLKTLDELRPIICRELGCLQVTVSQPNLQKDRVIVNEKWATHRDALRHFRSESFFVLRGATNVLAQPVKMTIRTELEIASVDLKNQVFWREIYLWAEKILSESGT